jgi:hypothetical protein
MKRIDDIDAAMQELRGKLLECLPPGPSDRWAISSAQRLLEDMRRLESARTVMRTLARYRAEPPGAGTEGA